MTRAFNVLHWVTDLDATLDLAAQARRPAHLQAALCGRNEFPDSVGGAARQARDQGEAFIPVHPWVPSRSVQTGKTGVAAGVLEPVVNPPAGLATDAMLCNQAQGDAEQGLLPSIKSNV